MSRVVTSLQNETVKRAASLHLKKNRDELKLFLVEGAEFCVMAIENGWECDTIFTLPGELAFLPDRTVEVTPDILAKISKKDNPQSVIGMFAQRDNQSPKAQNHVLALEEIRDPGNLGTILRTAHAVGMRSVILIGPCCDVYNPETIRASMGSFAVMQVAAMGQTMFLDWASRARMRVIGTDVVDATDYRLCDYRNAVIVMGNEQRGLSDEIRERCDSLVKIPMPGGAESLNVAMASTLLLYEAIRPDL